MMKKMSTLLTAVAMVFALGYSSVAFGKEVSRSIKLHREGKVGQQTLSKGDYTIKFVEDQDGELVLFKGKKEISRATYKLTQLSEPAPDTSVIWTAAADGSFQIKRIEFKGKTTAIVID